jgi:hypothetical protein
VPDTPTHASRKAARDAKQAAGEAVTNG